LPSSSRTRAWPVCCAAAICARSNAGGHCCAGGGDERLLRRGGLWLITGGLRTQPLCRRCGDRLKLPRQRIHN
jgi:hypothetical protein